MKTLREAIQPGADFAGAYPDFPARLHHSATQEEILRMPALLELARHFPKESIEYNAGDLPIDQDPETTPMNGLSPEETIARIRDCRSWLVLKNVEQSAPYAALMERLLSAIAPGVRLATGEMHAMQGYVFVSSPEAVTPFHMDPEHNVLLQVEGEKTMWIYPRSIAAGLPASHHEAYHAGERHRNLEWREEYEATAMRVDLAPGDAVYVPVKAPHRVQVGSKPSVSLSLTWRSARSDREGQLHLANRALRSRGFSPSPVGQRPRLDDAKVILRKIANRLS